MTQRFDSYVQGNKDEMARRAKLKDELTKPQPKKKKAKQKEATDGDDV